MRTCGFEVAVGEGKNGKMCPCVCVHVLVYGGKGSALILFK